MIACASIFSNLAGKFIVGAIVGGGIFLVAYAFKKCRRSMGKWRGTIIALALTLAVAFVVVPRVVSIREKTLRTSSNCYAKQIGLALAQYCVDRNNVLPPTLDVLVPHLIPRTVLIDPVTRRPFVYVGPGLIWQSNIYDVVVYSPPTTGGANVLFGDGHVAWVSRKEFEELLKRQKR